MYFDLNEEQKSAKIEKEFNELMIQLDAAQREFVTSMENAGIDAEHLNSHLSNKDNFSVAEWEYIRQKRLEIDENHEKSETQAEGSEKTTRSFIENNWLYCR